MNVKYDIDKISEHQQSVNKDLSVFEEGLRYIESYFGPLCDSWESNVENYFESLNNDLINKIDLVNVKATTVDNYLLTVIENFNQFTKDTNDIWEGGSDVE